MKHVARVSACMGVLSFCVIMLSDPGTAAADAACAGFFCAAAAARVIRVAFGIGVSAYRYTM